MDAKHVVLGVGISLGVWGALECGRNILGHSQKLLDHNREMLRKGEIALRFQDEKERAKHAAELNKRQIEFLYEKDRVPQTSLKKSL